MKYGKGLEYREQFHNIIINLTNNADIAGRQFVETGYEGYLHQYKAYVKQIREIKEHILEVESKKQG